MHEVVSQRDEVEQTPLSFAVFVKVWARIGWLSFGGPAAQIALMHRELVDRRRWISESRFLHALNYCMLLPGPEAQQLATYIGWLLHRTWGGIVAGALFVIPGLLAMLLLSWIYVRFQGVAAVSALFFGLKAAVLAIVLEAMLRIARRALRNRSMVMLAAAAFVAMFFFKVPFPWVIVAAAIIGLLLPERMQPASPSAHGDTALDDSLVDRLAANGQLAHAKPNLGRAVRITLTCLILWLTPVAIAIAWLGADHVIAREGVIFSQTALITFGGAYAVLSYVAQRAVEDLHWLRPGEMIDGLALAETTPGPLIMVLQFVGFLAAHRFAAPVDPWIAAVIGALLTTWVTFLPCFLFILLGGPYVETLRGHRGLNAALSAITAAVVGVILNLSVWFALHTIFGRVAERSFGPLQTLVPEWSTFDPAPLLLAAGAYVAMTRFKVGMGWTLLVSAILGAAYASWR
jgi:chromate transporter